MGLVFSIGLLLMIIGAVVTAWLANDSICNDGDFGGAAMLTSVAIIIVNLFTLIASSIFFQAKTHVSQARVAVHNN